MIRFRVHGVPQQQGSKSVSKSGHMYEANKKLRPWRELVTATARAAHTGPPLDGDLMVTRTYFLPRPKNHYRTGKFAGHLKPGAPMYANKVPDLDKLDRAINDALTDAEVITDDARIVISHSMKLYADPEPEGVQVKIETLEVPF